MPTHRSLPQLLRCPACNEPLSWPSDSERDQMIRCGCGALYPLIGGVPRMFATGPTPELLEHHRDFFAREAVATHRSTEVDVKERTSRAFGFEWNEFPDYHADNYERMLGPAMDVPLDGKLVLEVGCGAGRHSIRSASRGAHVVALDYSLAVEAASANCRSIESIEVVQGDVFKLPFASGSFDGAYSLGVLHHTPDPEGAFREVVRRVKPGGVVFIWVYRKTMRKILFEPFRKLLTYLSPQTLKKVSYVAALVDYGIFCQLYRLLSKMGGPLRAAARLFPNRTKEYATYDFSVSYTDWYDRISAPIVRFYSESEIAGWFTRAGLTDVVISTQADFGVRGLGRVAGGQP